MKTTGTKKINNMKVVLSVLFALLLLTGCGAASNAKMDLMMAKANGTIEKSERISADELNRILNRHFGKVDVKISDYEYELPDNGKVVELSSSTLFNSIDSINDRSDWDCDDYAIAAMVPLRNYAFGAMYVKTASGSRHAMNVFVNRNREVVYWEPQTNEYYNGQFYKPDLIVF